MFLLTLFPNEAFAEICDADGDGDVDQRDIRLIVGARSTPASGPDDPRDADRNGTISVQDARRCVKRCSLQRCAIIVSGSSSSDSTASSGETRNAQDNASSDQSSAKDTPTATKLVWKVKRGDTLYAIGRAIFPGDATKQARLREDIVRLNPTVFVAGANKMSVGVDLTLPDYVATESSRVKVVKRSTTPEPEPKTTTQQPEPEDTQPVAAAEPESQAQAEPESQAEPVVAERRSRPSDTEAEGNYFVSAGYSAGGDTLVEIDGSYDIEAGSGGQFRIGYDRIYPQGHGYRLALGLQFNVVFDDSETTTFRDIYTQLAYQYQADQIAYGIGVVLHSGATVDETSTVDYDAANGLFIFIEDARKNGLGGWGLSLTSLEIENSDDGEEFDASRVELYYSWDL